VTELADPSTRDLVDLAHRVTTGGAGISGSTFFVGSDEERLVLRMQRRDVALEQLPAFDVGRQAELLSWLGERSRVPVPRVRRYEPDASVAGAPFVVMERVDGRVPPDVPPYTFGGWVTSATPHERSLLQDEAVRLLAEVHAAEVARSGPAFLDTDTTADAALRRHVATYRAAYERRVRADGRGSSLIERGFAWLDAHFPDAAGEAVLSWGDCRIGNIVFRDHRAVAALDWELADMAPREVDLGWLVFLHAFFQDLAECYGRPGLPELLRGDDVCRRYNALTGVAPRDMRFYRTYAAVRLAVVVPEIPHRRLLAAMVEER
jgi:aminoglycoside phosphotransferase (APT) family kinase protein